jgi:hypothetical protein
MRFKQYLTELNNKTVRLLTRNATDSKTLTINEIRDEINSRLNHELTDKLILSPENLVFKVFVKC